MYKDKHLTPLQAIREKCLDCSCGNAAEVRRCEITSCSLYPYRFGRRPDKSTLVKRKDLKNVR